MAMVTARRSGRNPTLVSPSCGLEDICDRMGQLRNLAFGDIAAARHQAWPAGTVIS